MYELQVEQMSCGHCASTVTKSIQAVDADATVEVDLAQHKVRVQSTAALNQVAAAITAAGYPVVGSTTV